jgi:deoxyribodipyrimidine photolyase-related protein
MKLVYHRATMKEYTQWLENVCKKKGIAVVYVPFSNAKGIYKKYANDTCYGYEVFDYEVEATIEKENPNFIWMNSKNFLLTRDEMTAITLRRHNAFYAAQRKRLDILMMTDGKTPIGGKFSFDAENRKKLDSFSDPLGGVTNNFITKDAYNYVKKHFPDNYGDYDVLYYPVSREDALNSLKLFITKKLLNFTYQDAIYKPNGGDLSFADATLYHSVLSPMLNIGLLTDTDILQAMKKPMALVKRVFTSGTAAEKKEHYQLLCSIEGFIRQIIGWRQYMLYIYVNNPDIIYENFMKYKKKINEKVHWEGTTGITPVDDAIKKIKKYAYAHHIERLMILGNYTFMSGYHPYEVYRMFMCWTIDAYDWVMASNIFTMSQFATATSYTTKPYYSSANYIIGMSNYKKNEPWVAKFNEIYDNFKKTQPWIKKYNRF